MFKGHEVITDEDVGNYIKGLEEDTKKQMKEDYAEEQLDLLESEHALDGNSIKPTSWTKSKTGLHRVR